MYPLQDPPGLDPGPPDWPPQSQLCPESQPIPPKLIGQALISAGLEPVLSHAIRIMSAESCL